MTVFRSSLASIPIPMSSPFQAPNRKRVNPFREGDVVVVSFPSGIPMKWRICTVGSNVVSVESLPNLNTYPIDRLVLIEMCKDARVSVIPREMAILADPMQES